MQTDCYTKVMLTLLTIFTGVLALRQLLEPARVAAQNPPLRQLHFHERLLTFGAPKGGSYLGRVAIDLKTGNVYGFPTDAAGYPMTTNREELTVSRPVLLGRYDLSGIE
jgi:hypothetical protein